MSVVNVTWTYDNDQISVQSGDVWINSDIAYIYYTNAEINEGVYVDIITDGGGWKKADIWYLRTTNLANNGSSQENLLEHVNDTGTINITPGNNTSPYERILCPEFSI